MYKEMISVTDEMLFDLYLLDLAYIEPIQINREYYLVNKTGRKYKYELGLIAKIPNELLKDYSVDEVIDACKERREEFKLLVSLLTFSPKEMLLMNILLSNFFNTRSTQVPEISFNEIQFYRNKVSSYKNVSLNDITAESYRNAINSLISKHLYLKTTSNFRKTKKHDYGVTNRDFEQDLLTIYNPYLASSNNISFKYSFGEFGEVLRLCGRNTTIVPERCYHFSLNQGIYNVIACDIGRNIYYTRWKRGKAPVEELSNREYLGFDIDFERYFEFMHGKCKKNLSRQRTAFMKNLELILKSFVKAEQIDNYILLTDYKDFYKGKGSLFRVNLFFFT